MGAPTVTFVGTGEAFDPVLPNTSLLYQGAQTILLDCGYRVPHALWAITEDPSLIDAIYVTHQHADHAFGLPALLLRMREDGRLRPLKVIGGPGVGDWLWQLLDLGYSGAYRSDACYAIEPVALAPGDVLQLDELRLSNAQSSHPVRNLSVRIDEGDASFCYSGDGSPTDATRLLYQSAAVVVHECYSPRGGKRGHGAATDLLTMAEEARVGTLALLHVARTAKNEMRRVVERYDGPVRVVLAETGGILDVA